MGAAPNPLTDTMIGYPGLTVLQLQWLREQAEKR